MAGKKILCVEDNPLVVDMIKSVLEKEGFSLITASDGVEAIEKIHHEAPDLILLDVMMPKMSGYEVCRVIKEMNETKGLPIIMVTAKNHKIDKLWGKTTGADEYMTKPFEPPELLDKIKSLLHKYSPQIEESKKLLSQTDMFKAKQSLTIEDILSKVNEVLDRKLFESHLMAEINQIGHFKYGYEEVIISILDIFYKAIDYEAAAVAFPFKKENPFMIYSRKMLSQSFIENFKKKSLNLLPPDLRKLISSNGVKEKYKSKENLKEDFQKEKISSHQVSPMGTGGKVIGAFMFSSHIQNAYDGYKRKIIDMLTGHATPVIENALWLDAQRQIQEDKIKAEEGERWKKTFDSISEMVAIIDKDFKIVKVNKAFADTFKIKPGELVGKTCYEVAHGTKEPHPDCPHKQTMETKKPASIEFFEPRLGINLEVSTSPVLDEKGEAASSMDSVHIAKDISERKKMEKELAEKMRDLEKFYDVTMDREIRYVELKAEVNYLLQKLGKKPLYGATIYEKTRKHIDTALKEDKK